MKISDRGTIYHIMNTLTFKLAFAFTFLSSCLCSNFLFNLPSFGFGSKAEEIIPIRDPVTNDNLQAFKETFAGTTAQDRLALFSGTEIAVYNRFLHESVASKDPNVNVVSILTYLGGRSDWFVNEYDSGKTLLMTAARNNNLPVINQLLRLQAKVNLVSEEGMTAIYYALKCQPVSSLVVETLIKAGANVDYTDDHLMSPLELAVRSISDENILKLVLKGQCTAQTLFKALQISEIFDRTVASQLILENIRAKSPADCFNMFQTAVQKNLVTLFKNLLETVSFKLTKDHKVELIHYACELGYDNIVQLMISNGFSVDSYTKDGISLVMKLALVDEAGDKKLKNSHYKIAKLLIENGAELDTVGGPKNLLPFEMAEEAGKPELAKLFNDNRPGQFLY